MGSQAGTGETSTPLGDWITTAVIIVGAVLDAAAIIIGSVVMGAIGAALVFFGVAYVFFGGMLGRVEEYDTPREDIR